MRKWPSFFSKGSSMRRDCSEVRRRASEYLEADISEEEKARIRKHLKDCERCNRFVATLGATIRMLRGLPAHAAPQDLKARLLQLSRNQGQGHLP